MTRPAQSNFSSIESALRDAAGAHDAGVFQPTPVDAEVLLREGSARPHRLSLAARGWIAAAAVFLFMATAWTLIFYREFGEMRERLTDSASRAQTEAMLMCFGGPTTQPLPSECIRFDSDADGDMDMADWRSHQVAFASTH